MLAACDKTETVLRSVNLDDLPSCKIEPGTSGFWVATGDFAPAVQTVPLATDQPQTLAGVPADVQSLALVATKDVSTWQGVTLVPPSGDVDVLLLPNAQACSLVGKVGFSDAMPFAAVSPHTMIAIGGSLGSSRPSFRIDLDTGRVAQMTVGIKKVRDHAATVALGGGLAVVTGGISEGVAQPSAEFFDEAAGDFDPNVLTLAEERADHGAVALASGDVLLVGGKGANGLIAATERLHFDAPTATWRSSEGATPNLVPPRVDPLVARLADGTVLVAGGTDAGGAPVADVQVFSADATQSPSQNVSLLARAREAMVALDGGGALFVAAPDASDPPDFQRAWFVTAGAATAVAHDVTAPLDDPRLFPRAGGGAWLWTGSTWLAYDPWTNGFSRPADAPTDGPEAGAPSASSEPGLRAWVESDGSVSLWRDSIRNAFATDGAFLGPTSGTTSLAPASQPAPAFDAVTGLALGAGDTVFVSDARFLDVNVDVDTIDTPPRIVLRGPREEIEVGGASCPYPAALAGPLHVHVERRGAFVSYTLDGLLEPCATMPPNLRVSVGIRGGAALSHALDFSVARADAALH